ncbi:MAG: citramalate synthase [Rhodobacter sp.]|nr:citramalate synthase [Rhodobacter sp.]
MSRERLYLFDTTLRDGQQTHGVLFSTADKLLIVELLDALGLDYIEGGWPGANPTDTAFFEEVSPTRATFTAFGMTKRTGRSAENDDVLAAVINANTPAVCLVGKTHDFHVETALGVTLRENLDNIAASIAHVAERGREALFDAEHFFDGYKANPEYALECLRAAYHSGARWVVLCDTNGGTLPAEVTEITGAVIAAGIPGTHVGIHTHDDTGNAVANTLAAIDSGARQIQGTLNGLGERCGNANLTSIIPTLLLKPRYRERYRTDVTPTALAGLTRASRLFDDLLNRVPDRAAPYVGTSAFAHKAGLHASAILKDPSTYEHIEPAVVGNDRLIPISNQAGQSNLRKRLLEMGLSVTPDDGTCVRILDLVKRREERGYSYETAQASFELLARRELGLEPDYFEVERYRVITERRRNARGEIVVESEAVVSVSIDGSNRTIYFKNDHPNNLHDDGPVNALWQALKADLGSYRKNVAEMRLVDFKVRITHGGADAVTRVIIDFSDIDGHKWSTVGVSANIVDASFEALVDAINWKLIRDVGIS